MFLRVTVILLAIAYAAVSVFLFRRLERIYTNGGEFAEEFQHAYARKSWLGRRWVDLILILFCITWPVTIINNAIRNRMAR